MVHIDLLNDELIPVKELAKQRLGKQISPACLWRWIRKGVRGCRLEAVQVCGWRSTPAAFEAFITGQTVAAFGADAPAAPVTERSAETKQKLAAAGLL